MTDRNQVLFITGGSGFIGRSVILFAHSFGYQVVSVDLRQPSLRMPGAQYICGDIRNGDLLTSLLKETRPTHVLHLASDVDINITDKEQLTTITEGSRVLFESVGNIVPDCRLIHASTQYVLKPGLSPLHDLHFEPYTTYGEAKADSEVILRRTELNRWSIVRPTIVWGPHHPTFGDQLWKYIHERKYIHPHSKHAVKRTYGYVDNVAFQMMRLMSAPLDQVNRRVFYLGDGVMDYSEWIDAFSFALTGYSAHRVPKLLLMGLGAVGEVAKQVGFQFPFDMGRYYRMTTPSQIDLTPILNIAGSPPVTFDQGLRNTVEWLRAEWQVSDLASAR